MPDTATGPYLPLILVGVLAVALAGVMLALSGVVTRLTMRNRRRSPMKNLPYECGMPLMSDAHTRFSVKFYIVAMLFILFDVEVVFLYPGAVLYGRGEGARGGIGLGFLFLELLVFVAVLFLGWLYVVRKGVLEWQTEG